MLKEVKMTVEIDETPIKLLLGNDIQRIQEQIMFARGLNNTIVKLKDGTKMGRIAWILESEKELKLLQDELKKFL